MAPKTVSRLQERNRGSISGLDLPLVDEIVDEILELFRRGGVDRELPDRDEQLEHFLVTRRIFQ